MRTVARRPQRIVRFYAAGVPVTPEQFWEAVRLAGGEATVVAHDPKPVPEEEIGYVLTELGRRALAEAEAEAGQ